MNANQKRIKKAVESCKRKQWERVELDKNFYCDIEMNFGGGFTAILKKDGVHVLRANFK